MQKQRSCLFVSKKEKEKIDFGAMSEDTILVCENPQVLEKGVFEKQMLEKLIWISAFMLVGARHPGATVGVVEKEYRSEVSSLIAELASVAAAERGLSFGEGMEERLCAYSRAVAHYPTAVKEFKWRNGWFYSLT